MVPEHHIGSMLVLRRKMTSDTSGEWSDEEFDVFNDGALVGRILRSPAASSDRPWLCTINRQLSGGPRGRGYAEDLEAAMAELSSQWEATGPSDR
jgi:hypothetical protein